MKMQPQPRGAFRTVFSSTKYWLCSNELVSVHLLPKLASPWSRYYGEQHCLQLFLDSDDPYLVPVLELTGDVAWYFQTYFIVNTRLSSYKQGNRGSVHFNSWSTFLCRFLKSWHFFQNVTNKWLVWFNAFFCPISSSVDTINVYCFKNWCSRLHLVPPSTYNSVHSAGWSLEVTVKPDLSGS